MPKSTNVRAFQKESIEQGMHVLELFAGIIRGGLGTVIEPSFVATYYSNAEIDDISRATTRQNFRALQEEFLGQLPKRAIPGYNERIPQVIQFIDENDLTESIAQNGLVHFKCSGWGC